MTKVMGMMSGCYFVGRGELLEWVNNLLKTSYSKVEELSNGAAFCQILDCIHPGTVALGRVNFNASQPFEMTQNYRVLQDSFHKNNITQYIDVPTITKGKYMAALEACQWIHGYYEQTGPHEEYDAIARRKITKCSEPRQQTSASTTVQSGFPTSKPNIPIKGKDPTIGQIGSHFVRKSQKKESSRVSTAKGSLPKQFDNELKKENELLIEKLKKIEAYCNENIENDVIQPIIGILQPEADI